MDVHDLGDAAQSLEPEPKHPRLLLFCLMAALLGVTRAPWLYIGSLILLSATYQMTRTMLLMRRLATGEDAFFFILESLIINGGTYLGAMGMVWLLATLGFSLSP